MVSLEEGTQLSEAMSIKKEVLIVLESLKEEKKSIGKTIEKAMKDMAAQAGSSKALPGMPEPTKASPGEPHDYKELRRVIGDFHITPQSRTYRELYEENAQLARRAAALEKELHALQPRITGLEKKAEEKEKEIMALRKTHLASISQLGRETPGKKKRKPFSPFRRRSAKPAVPESMKREALLTFLVRSQAFSDEQAAYLANVCRRSALPAQPLARLFDARLTVPRMRMLYALLCEKHQIREDIGAGMEQSLNGEADEGKAHAAAASLPDASACQDAGAPADASRPPVLVLDADARQPSGTGRESRLGSMAKSCQGILARRR